MKAGKVSDTKREEFMDMLYIRSLPDVLANKNIKGKNRERKLRNGN